MPKLICTPSSVSPRCGETVRVRVDTDPAATGKSIDQLPSNGAISVNPIVGATNHDGFTYFEITCENRSGSCEGGTVTFKATGYESCSVTVSCHSFQSRPAGLIVDEINQVRVSLAESQGRLAVLGQMDASGVLPVGPPPRPPGWDLWVAELFPQELVHVDADENSQVIGYASVAQKKLFVLKSNRKQAIAALGGQSKGNQVAIPEYDAPFDVEETATVGTGAEDDTPSPGSVRVRVDRVCGPLTALRQGQCRKLYDELYVKAVYFARALCKPAPEKLCVEKYIPYAEVRFYRKPGCEEFIEKSSIYGWLCKGGPPKYY